MVQIVIIEQMDYSGEAPPSKGIFYILKWGCDMHGEYDLIREYYSLDGTLIQKEVIGIGAHEFELIQSAFKKIKEAK